MSSIQEDVMHGSVYPSHSKNGDKGMFFSTDNSGGPRPSETRQPALTNLTYTLSDHQIIAAVKMYLQSYGLKVPVTKDVTLYMDNMAMDYKTRKLRSELIIKFRSVEE